MQARVGELRELMFQLSRLNGTPAISVPRYDMRIRFIREQDTRIIPLVGVSVQEYGDGVYGFAIDGSDILAVEGRVLVMIEHTAWNNEYDVDESQKFLPVQIAIDVAGNAPVAAGSTPPTPQPPVARSLGEQLYDHDVDQRLREIIRQELRNVLDEMISSPESMNQGVAAGSLPSEPFVPRRRILG